MNKNDLLKKRTKELGKRITKVRTYHPALNKVYEILQKAQNHSLPSVRLSTILPSPSTVAFHNAKTSRDKLVRSIRKTYGQPMLIFVVEKL